MTPELELELRKAIATHRARLQPLLNELAIAVNEISADGFEVSVDQRMVDITTVGERFPPRLKTTFTADIRPRVHRLDSEFEE